MHSESSFLSKINDFLYREVPPGRIQPSVEAVWHIFLCKNWRRMKNPLYQL